MKRLLGVAFTLLTVISVMGQAKSGTASRNGNVPDFAYPDKVERTAMRDLDDALKRADGPATVNALVRVGLAKAVVSSDSLPEVLSSIDRVMGQSNDVAVKSLLCLLQARIYTAIYSSRSYQIDRRPTVSSIAGDDYNQWSKRQFLDKVVSLVSVALDNQAALMQVPLESYSDVIVFERSSIVFYPTLYDFAAYQAIESLMRFDSYNILNPRLALSPMDSSLYPQRVSESVSGDVLGIYRSLCAGRGDSAPAIIARRNQIGYILARMKSTEDNVPLWARMGMPQAASRGYEAYMSAYREYASSPYSVELLLALEPDNCNHGEKTALFALLEEYMADNPAYFNINGVKNLRNRLAMKSVNLTVPSQGAKGDAVKVVVESQNVNKMTLSLYDVTESVGDNGMAYYRMPANRPSPVTAVEVSFDGNVPFSAEQEVAMTLPDYGLYVIVPTFSGQQGADRSYPIVTCSDLTVGVFSGVGGSKAVAVDAVSGTPREGVSMYFRPWSRAQSGRALPGTTGSDGFLAIAEETQGSVSPRMVQDRYAPACNYYRMSAISSDADLRGEIFTSLNLYRLGDKVDFSVVAYETSRGNRHSIAAGRSLRVGLRDANYQEIDTLRVMTDEWGRAEGSFRIPEDGLTGNFSITLGDGESQVAFKSFMVSDYKLPTFAVKVTDVKRPVDAGSDARVSGEALTFAGFPVGEAQVKVQLSVRMGSWMWATVSPVFYEAEARTDSKGCFDIVIPSAVIASSPAPGGYFITDIAVTSPDGETREAKSGFNMGKPLTISTNIPQPYLVGGDGVACAEVYDYNGNKQSIELAYTIKSVVRPLYGGDTVYGDAGNGRCLSGDISGLLSSLPSGEYSAMFAPADSTLADAVYTDFTVYRATDTDSPVNTLLWLPERRLTADADGMVDVTYASAVEQPHVLMVVGDSDGNIAETRWLAPTGGMEHVKVKLPSADKPARVYFHITSRLSSASGSLDIRPASSQQAISVATETFRDKVTPGDKETLTFKVKGMHGASPECAVILDMSNKAIDLLNPNPFNFVPADFWGRSLGIDGMSFGHNGVSVAGALRMLKAAGYSAPEWEFYGQSFVPSRANRLYNMKIRGTAKMTASNDAVEEMMAVEEVAMVEDVAMASTADAGSGVLMESEVVSTSQSGSATVENGTYRPAEIPLAFFRPLLQTDSDGTLVVTYTVPDANTTWLLRSLAYNSSLLTAAGETEIVASKPLMVSANATRFLRTGDSVKLLASIMNSTDSAVVAASVCELIDVSSGEVLKAVQSTDTICAMERSIVTIDFVVPDGLKGVIYRVKSSSGSYTDGEQTLVPVLASEQDVVESDMFYIAPGQNHFTKPLNAVTDGRAYLKFTENPAWEVVSALPGLRENQINSSLEAAAAIFSAAVADGLMRNYPEIARTLRKWRDNPADSALVSQLEKNDELKTILLSSTAWVADALDQTERMQRLVLLLDSRNTSRVIEKGIADLAKTATADGGWSWTRQYHEPSEWCTARVLEMLGDLNRLGWLPADKQLDRMIENAVAYTDRNVAKRFAKYPKADYTSYCYMRSKFPAVKQSSAAARVTREMVQRIIGGWKENSVVMKAFDAIILNDNGYNATARQILESLRQYATETPEKGMWWQQLENTWFHSMNKVGCTAVILDAFALVEPGNRAIDKIKQWLILEKVNTDWGNAVITSQVITSILTSGTPLTVNPSGTAIRIGGTLVAHAHEEYATGAFTEQVTSLLREPATLTIDRQGDYPSLGAIVSMRRAPMAEIRPVACAELSVEKHLSVFNGSEWVTSDSFKVGDRVKVSIVLKADADMDYVVIQDPRAAALEPVEQLPSPLWSEGLCFYRENRDAQTNIFIDSMPRGTYRLEYELFATQSGSFSSGTAIAQSHYNPAIAAHSGGMRIVVN